MAKIIPLTQGQVTIVDDEDFEYVSQHNWRAKRAGRHGDYWYAALSGGTKTIFLHRLLVNAQPGEDVDHKNHATLDNRRSNLRRATRSQNNANKGR